MASSKFPFSRRNFLQAGNLALAPALAAAEAAPAWKPFRPRDSSTLRIVNKPAARATRNQIFHWELEWRPEVPVPSGTELELRSFNLRSFLMWRYTTIEADRADVTYRRRQNLQSAELFAMNGRWTVARFRVAYGMAAGEALRIRLGVVPPYVTGLHDALSLWTAAAPPPGAGGSAGTPNFKLDPNAEVIMEAGPNAVEKLAIYCHPMPGADGKVKTVLAPQDRYGNTSSFASEMVLELEWEGKQWREPVRGIHTIYLDAPKDVGRLRAKFPWKSLAATEDVSNGKRDGGNVVVTGNPVWREAPGGLMAAFGEFHWHTEISRDGSGSTDDALRFARDELNMNFATSSDHTPAADQWPYIVETHDKYNQPGEFVTFYGYEHSTSVGHENYYFLNPRHPVSPVGEAKLSMNLVENAERIAPYNTATDPFIAIPHHTNSVSETRRISDDVPFWQAYPWSRPTSIHRAVEVFQTRGNQERDDYPCERWRGWYMNNASVQSALARGYRLGFTGGTDNHTSRPGRCFAAEEAAGRMPGHSIGLTGLWVEKVTREKVFEALARRHSWAVWDTRALVFFAVNGVVAGDVVEVSSGASLSGRLKISAEDSLRSVEIVSERTVVWSSPTDGLDFDVQIPLGAAQRTTHFYLRAMQADGAIIYATPVYVTVKG